MGCVWEQALANGQAAEIPDKEFTISALDFISGMMLV
jgi:hypothetical protein